jgi:hypothetical protein
MGNGAFQGDARVTHLVTQMDILRGLKPRINGNDITVE